ncbi:hypothetical protein ACEWY4_021870 [Coilia grayii]|uniref:VWFA domain-containing protein n=1 Tax=Coilia grayii TaxID=363190 RepID=A0ABD1J4F7_9TELE
MAYIPCVLMVLLICLSLDHMACHGPEQATDIAFLLDSSGSVRDVEFKAMKQFVINLIKKLLKKDTQFAIAQYSSSCDIHVNFSQFNSKGLWEKQVENIHRISGGTNTAAAITKLANELFVTSGGARPDATKVLIVITDGQSVDGYNLPSAIDMADAKNIIRFAVGVGKAFENSRARQELNMIATSATDHVFVVDNFDTLEKISSSIENHIKIMQSIDTNGVKPTSSSSSSSNSYLTKTTATTASPNSGQIASPGVLMIRAAVCVCLLAAALTVTVLITRRKTSAGGETVTYTNAIMLRGGENNINTTPVDTSTVYDTVQK